MTQREPADWRVQRAPMDAPTGYPWKVLHPDTVRSFATQSEAFEYAVRRADKCTVCGGCAHDHGGWSHAYTRDPKGRVRSVARTEDVSTLAQAPGTVRAVVPVGPPFPGFPVTDVLLPHGCGVCAGMLAGWCGACGRLCSPGTADVYRTQPPGPVPVTYADVVKVYNELVASEAGELPDDIERVYCCDLWPDCDHPDTFKTEVGELPPHGLAPISPWPLTGSGNVT